ncbi:MAG: MoaD family protein [Canidatus Methanoxibalbensis ujae]|nr:MoaD family protein [Candidatus Methanoxibalbensis ujae]MCW7078493.1 MoaD family protein [Candidatus Methanoxibalbensis ujae]
MKVKVKLFASFRDIVGKSAVELDVREDATLREVLLMLFQSEDARLKIFEDATKLRDYVIVLKNGKHDGLLTKLEDGDEISVFPQVFGG